MGCRISGCCLLDRKRPVNCRPFPRYLHFEPLLLRIFGRRQERRQCSAHRFFAGKAARDIAGQRPRARVPEICRGLDAGDIGKCGTLAWCAQQGVCFACFCTFSRRGAKPLCLVPSGGTHLRRHSRQRAPDSTKHNGLAPQREDVQTGKICKLLAKT